MNARSTEFLTELRVLDVTEGVETHTLELEEDFIVYSKVLAATICASKGFRCDGESIPDSLHWLVPPFGQSKRGAIIHDYLYRNGGYFSEVGQFIPVTRKTADMVYRELVEAKGLPAWRASVRFSILRMVGWMAWNENAKKREVAP